MTAARHPNAYQAITFVRSIAVLALPAAAQLRWLRAQAEFELPIDELALEFDDGWVLLNNFLEGELIPRAAVPGLTRLDGLLSKMSGTDNANLWTAEALASRPEWDSVRDLALSVLELVK